jgi:redox-sensitive bicupin YhaK (pirin superfamily)
MPDFAPVRAVEEIFTGTPTVEGAGVHLRRIIGHPQVPKFDPFLLLDDFHSPKPADYLPGFPWHPHRGIETVTYMLEGRVEHGDSLGNSGLIGPGDVQWMTAGSGIIHQEMPQGESDGRMWGLQLWVSLPSDHKMMEPRYRDLKAVDIPEVNSENGVAVKVLAGTYQGAQGPARDIVCDPEYLDVRIPGGETFRHLRPRGHTVFAYVLEGNGSFQPGGKSHIAEGRCVLFGDGRGIEVTAGQGALRFVLVSGKPIREPVAWYGPIVMNSEEELRRAFREYREGTFLKHAPPADTKPKRRQGRT